MKISKIPLAALLLFCVLVFAIPAVSAQQVMQARIHLADKAQMKDVVGLQLDIAYVEYGQYVDIITHQEEIDQLRSWGYEVEVVHEELVAF